MKSRMLAHVLAIQMLAGTAAMLPSLSFAMPMEERSGAPAGPMATNRLGQLHDQLKLTEHQETLWNRAQAASRAQMRARMGERQQELRIYKEALADPQVDLRALSRKMDARRDQALKESREMRELWLALYDSLDARQREVARRFLLERIEYMEQAGGRMNQHKGRGGSRPGLPHDMDGMYTF